MFSYSAVVDQTRQVYLVENLPPPLKMKNLNNYSVIDKNQKQHDQLPQGIKLENLRIF